MLSLRIPNANDGHDLFDMLKKNFDRAYEGNTRAPLSLSMTYKYLDVVSSK